MIRFFFKWICRIAILAAAFLTMQFPAFLYHYLAHLRGHLAELSIQLAALSMTAASVNKTLKEWILKFSTSQDPDVALQGEFLAKMVDRKESLEGADAVLQNGSLLSKPFYFIRTLDLEIAQESLKDFSLSLPLNAEGLFYAVLGAVLGWLVLQAIFLPFRRSKKEPVEPDPSAPK